MAAFVSGIKEVTLTVAGSRQRPPSAYQLIGTTAQCAWSSMGFAWPILPACAPAMESIFGSIKAIGA